MLMEFDCRLQGAVGKDLGSKLKYAVYGELARLFGYDTDQKGLRQQQSFEELLNWFTFDWYDEPDEILKTKKMEWRVKFLDRPKKRSRHRFISKLRAEMGKKGGNAKRGAEAKDKESKAVLSPEDIPWDKFNSEIYNLTSFEMERAALKSNDMDEAAHALHTSLQQSIAEYLVDGKTAVTMHDI